jgi:hypothetical protein
LVTLIILYLVRSKIKKLLIVQSSPAFCHFLPLSQNILNTQFSNTLNQFSSLRMRNHIHTHTNQDVKL